MYRLIITAAASSANNGEYQITSHLLKSPISAGEIKCLENKQNRNKNGEAVKFFCTASDSFHVINYTK